MRARRVPTPAIHYKSHRCRSTVNRAAPVRVDTTVLIRSVAAGFGRHGMPPLASNDTGTALGQDGSDWSLDLATVTFNLGGRGLSRLLHVDLHWMDVPKRVQYKLSVTVRRCQQHKALQYLTDCVTPASDIASRQRLRCASRHQLLVPHYQLSSLGRRSFAVVGPTT